MTAPEGSAGRRAAAEGWAGRIRYVAGPAEDDLGLDAVLLRPDGVVAWAGGPEPFEEAASRWFGVRTRP